MRNSAIHVSFAIGISLTPLSGIAAEELPVPSAVFQYLDEADFECNKEQPLRGMIVSPAVPLKYASEWASYLREQDARKYMTIRRGTNRVRVEIRPESADDENRIEPKDIETAALTIEYSAHVCVGIINTTVVAGDWSISGESEKHDFSAKGDFFGPAVKIRLIWQDVGERVFITAGGRDRYSRKWLPGNPRSFASRPAPDGRYGKESFPRNVDTIIYFTELVVTTVEKASFHRRSEENFTGTLWQGIEFQPDKPLSNGNTNQPNTSLPIRKE